MAKTNISKKDARIQRKLEKSAKNKEKSVRLSSNIKIKEKYIRSTVKPKLEKNPRTKDPDNYKNCFFSWCDTQSDTEDMWSWRESRKWDDREYNETILPHMNSYKNCPWKELEVQTYNGKDNSRKLLNKYQTLDSICNEAQNRWLNLETVYEFDELFRFRLGTYRRIWGLRIQHHFYMIWYERYHKICPFNR